jgi:hypothetical protein
MAFKNEILREDDSELGNEPIKVGDVFSEADEEQPIIQRYNEYSDFGPPTNSAPKSVPR